MSSPTRQLQVLDGEDDGTLLRVAFASADRETVDQHFGSSRAFVIYGVNPEHAQLLKVIEFGDLEQDGNEDKLVSKLELLDGCIAVYCRACGASAVRQLLASALSPERVAALVLDAIRGDRFWVLPHPDWKAYVQTRMEDVLEDRNPSPEAIEGLTNAGAPRGSTSRD